MCITCDISLGLTFASLNALKPPVINVSVADTSAVLKPGAPGGATTGSVRLLKLAALWARHHIS